MGYHRTRTMIDDGVVTVDVVFIDGGGRVCGVARHKTGDEIPDFDEGCMHSQWRFWILND